MLVGLLVGLLVGDLVGPLVGELVGRLVGLLAIKKVRIRLMQTYHSYLLGILILPKSRQNSSSSLDALSPLRKFSDAADARRIVRTNPSFKIFMILLL